MFPDTTPVTTYTEGGDISFNGLPVIHDGKITVRFNFGRYRPAYYNAHKLFDRNQCYSNETLGLDPSNGGGYGTSTHPTVPSCLAWGNISEYGFQNRGFSPQLLIGSIGRNYPVDVTNESAFVFAQRNEGNAEDLECSPQRGIWTIFGNVTVKEMATALYEDKLDNYEYTRASCQPFGDTNGFTPPWTGYEAAGSGNMQSLFRNDWPFSYMQSGAADSPSWSFAVSSMDTSLATQTLTPTCMSRYITEGEVNMTIPQVAQCQGYKHASESEWGRVIHTENLGNGVTRQSWPVCIYKFHATKTNSLYSEAQLRKDERCVNMTIQVQSTASYTATELITQSMTGQTPPRAFVESVDLVVSNLVYSNRRSSDTSNTIVRQTVAGENYWVNKLCFDQCVTMFSASTACNDDNSTDQIQCADQCTVPFYTNLDPVKDSFGTLYVNGLIEMARSLDQQDVVYVEQARTFHHFAPAAGAANVYKVHVRGDVKKHSLQSQASNCAKSETRVLGDSTHSYVTIESRRKRILDVSTIGWTKVNVTYGQLQAVGWVQGAASRLETDKDVFKTLATPSDSACAADRWGLVPDGANLRKGHFPYGNNYAFQMQEAHCKLSNPGTCLNPVTQAAYCTKGLYQTINLVVDYSVNYKYLDTTDLEASMTLGVYQGVDHDSEVSFAGYTEAYNETLRDLINGTRKLKTSKPFELVVNMNTDNLGEHYFIHQETATLSVKAFACDPFDPTAAKHCANGFVQGRCGMRIDQADKVEPMHAFAGVVLASPCAAGTQACGEKAPSAARLTELLRQTPWYSYVRSKITEYGMWGPLSATHEVCWTANTVLSSLQPKTDLTDIWCPDTEVQEATVWRGSAPVVTFLNNINKYTCDPNNKMWVCQNGSCGLIATMAQWEYSVRKTLPLYQSCLGGATGTRQSYLFAEFFQIIQVVNDFNTDKVSIVGAGYTTLADVDADDCIKLTELNNTNEFQRLTVESDNEKCGALNDIIVPSTELILRARNIIPRSTALAITSSQSLTQARRGQHQQCLGTMRSPTLHIDMKTDAHSVTQRNTAKFSILFGPNVAIPCVEREVFMVSKLVDTYQPGNCRETKLTCESGFVKATNLPSIAYDWSSHIDGSAGEFAPQEGVSFDLYYHRPSPACNLVSSMSNATGCTPHKYSRVVDSGNGISVTRTPPVAMVEGLKVDVCGQSISSYSEEIKQSDGDGSMGVRWNGGALEYYYSPKRLLVEDFTTKNGKLLYIFPTSETSSYDLNSQGFYKIPCGPGKRDQASFENPALELSGCSNRRAASPITGARRLLQTQEVTVQSGGASQPLSNSATIPAGETQVETCANTQEDTARCRANLGYIHKNNYDTLVCSDNQDGECTHAYCCVAASSITINNYNTYNTHTDTGGSCEKIEDNETQVLMAFMTTFIIGAMMALVILINFVTLRVAIKYFPHSVFARKSGSNPTWRLAIMILSILLELTALVIAIVGYAGDDGWVEKCGLDGGGGWLIWLPIVIIIGVAVRMGFHIKTGLDNRPHLPLDNRNRAGSSLALASDKTKSAATATVAKASETKDAKISMKTLY